MAEKVEIQQNDKGHEEYLLILDAFRRMVYNYENGAYTEIPMTWNDAKRTLTIDARRGCYEGMLDERKFTVRMPDGSEKTVLYKGKKINVKF